MWASTLQDGGDAHFMLSSILLEFPEVSIRFSPFLSKHILKTTSVSYQILRIYFRYTSVVPFSLRENESPAEKMREKLHK